MKLCLLFLFLTSFMAFGSEPVGFYSEGHLENAESMPETGVGYIQMYRDTNHYWATREAIKMVLGTAAFMSKKYPNRDRMQVEEISAQEGGEVDGHGSHENGLDVDIQYYKANSVEHDPIATGRKFADPMVVNGKVVPNFDKERNWEFVKALHKFGKVQRIFMDQKLKNSLCVYAKSKKEHVTFSQVLRSIRHVDNHADHLHVRLRCPVNAKRCLPQEDTPTGTGCP